MTLAPNTLGWTPFDPNALLTWVERHRPSMLLMMDDLSLAKEVERRGTRVVFRRYRADDHEFHSIQSNGRYKVTPAEFLQSVADVPKSMIVQALNEPGGDQAALTDWTEEACAKAREQGRTLAVPNFSVGNPHEEAIRNGKYDPMLRAVIQYGHYFSVHEYFWDWPLYTDFPFHIGRYREWRARARVLRLSAPNILLTETGKDFGIGQGGGGGYEDGWLGRGVGWSPQDYITRLEQLNAILNEDHVTGFVFGYGRGAWDEALKVFRWDKFNIANHNEVMEAIGKMSSSVVITPPKDGLVPVDGYLAQLPPGYTYRYLRAKPLITSEQTGVITLNEPVTYYPDDVREGWMFMRSRETPTEVGWMFQQGVVLTPSNSGPVTLTRDEYNTVLSILKTAEKRQGGSQ